MTTTISLHYVILRPIIIRHATIIDAIKALYLDKFGRECDRVEVLPQSGSDRRYFRVHAASGNCIATSQQHSENDTFIYFSRHFKSRVCPFPEIYAQTADETIYLQKTSAHISIEPAWKEGLTGKNISAFLPTASNNWRCCR